MAKPIVEYLSKNHFLTTVILVAGAYFLFQIKTILLALFISYIIMAALTPIVRGLKRFRFPNFLAVIIVYSFVIAAIVLLIIPILPFFVSQIQALFKAIPTYLNLASQVLGFQVSNTQIENYLSPFTGLIGQNALSFTSRFFGGIFTVISIFVLSFYMLIEREKIGKALPNLLPEEYRQKGILTIHLVEQKLGAWLRGQIVLSLVVGTISWIILTILGIPFALPLAILAGVLEIIPTLGPIIAAIPAVIVALAISPIMGLSVILVYVGIQLAENNILVPKIMQKAVGLNPVVIIIAILIGARLFGVLGALLSIPFVSAAIITIRSFK